MNKLKLSALLLGGVLSANAQSLYPEWKPGPNTLNVNITKDSIELFGGKNYKVSNKWPRNEANIIYVGVDEVVNLNFKTGILNDSVVVHLVENDHYHEYKFSCDSDLITTHPLHEPFKIIVFGHEIDENNTVINYFKVNNYENYDEIDQSRHDLNTNTYR